MDIPTDVQTYDMPTSTIWVRDGIVYSTPKIGMNQTVRAEQMDNDLKRFREIVGDKKVCLVVEINPRSKPAPKEERDKVSAQMASFAKAMALIISSPVTRMMANLFFGFKPPPYHLKMFSNEKDATNWIKQYV